MCKVLGIIFLQTEWNGPIVRFLSNSYCVIVFPAWHESKKNEHSPRFEVCLASKSRIPELETQPEIWGNMYLLHYKSVKAVQVNIPYGQSSAPVILPFCTSRQTQIQIGPKKVQNLKTTTKSKTRYTWPGHRLLTAHQLRGSSWESWLWTSFRLIWPQWTRSCWRDCLPAPHPRTLPLQQNVWIDVRCGYIEDHNENDILVTNNLSY